MNIERRSTSGVMSIQGESASEPSASAPPSDAPALMPELDQLACSGDPGAMLAALTMQAAKNERDVSRAQRDNAEKMQEADEVKEIQDLHDKADLVRIQGFVDGFTQIGSAALNLGSGLADAHASGEAAETDADKADLQQHVAEHSEEWRDSMQHSVDTLEAGSAHSKANSAWDKAGSEGLGAGQKVADGLFQGAITDKDTDAKVHDMAAQAAKRMVDDARSDEGDAKQLMEKALEFYKEYSETRAQTMLAATHRA
ncbi:MAG TPA: hypothetical protein VLM85_19810 [Polyangiaceae bacterium]|nr:hypothetical protein [Polyangiaceae bacterium]